MDEKEARVTMRLAIGRLFRIAARPHEDGDVEEFYKCRGAVRRFGYDNQYNVECIFTQIMTMADSCLKNADEGAKMTVRFDVDRGLADVTYKDLWEANYGS